MVGDLLPEVSQHPALLQRQLPVAIVTGITCLQNEHPSPWDMPGTHGHAQGWLNKTNQCEQNKLVHITGKTRLELDEGNLGHLFCGYSMRLRGKATGSLVVVTLSKCVFLFGGCRIFWVSSRLTFI